MAYNSSKGPQTHGDVQYEGDPAETQIDFENDFVAIKTNGQQRFIVSGSFITSSVPLSCSVAITAQSLNTNTTVISATHISSSRPVSASALFVNGVPVAAGAITTYSNAANNRIITSVNATSVQGEAGLTYNGTVLSATGQISASLGVTGSSLRTTATVIDATHISSSLNISGSKFYGDGANLTNTGIITTYSNAANNRVLTSVDASSINGESGLTYNGSILAATGQISASLGVSGSAVYADQGVVVRAGTNFATVINGVHVSSSLNASASAFYVDTPGILEIHKSDNGHAQLRTQTAHFQIRNKANNKDIRFQLGEDVGATGVKVRNDSSAEVASIDSQGDAVFRHITASLGVTGSSLHTNTTVINATHVSSSLNVSASAFYVKGVEVGAPAVAAYTNSGDNRIVTSVNSNTINAEARLTFNDSTNFLFLSGNAQITNHLPYIFFSNSAGTGLGYMGYNSSNNILIQNNTSNKHIVFKTNDNGNIKEAFRMDGAVPEVVVNQGSESLIDFRVESNNNTHMIFSDGTNDRVGINTDTPTHTLSVSGTMQVSGAFTAKTMEWTQCAFQYGATSEIFIPFEGTGESNNPDWENQFIAPFPGSLKRILVRPENTQNGNISASVWFGANTVAEIDGGVRVEDAIGANAGSYTTTTINFTGSNHFAPGDIVGVSIKPRLNPGKINLTCIWEFDKTIF